MGNWLQGLKDYLSPKENEVFIKTNHGKVGRVEQSNKETGTLSISFGSFNSEGEWNIKKTITISEVNVHSTLTREECAKELQVINRNKTREYN